MVRFFCILLTFVFLPLLANATSNASITSSTCSGNLTISLLGGASFACAGNLTLDGGFVTSDSLINISADGDLFLDNLTFTAPNVIFSNLSRMLTIGRNTVVNGGLVTVTFNSGVIHLLGTLNTKSANIGFSQDTNFVVNPGGNVNLDYGVTVTKGNLGGLEAIIPRVGGSLTLDNGNGIVSKTDFPVIGGTVTVEPSAQFISATAVSEFNAAFVLSAVPEPTTYAMMLLGVFCLMNVRRKTI